MVPSYWKQIIQADFKTDAPFVLNAKQAQEELRARIEITRPQIKYAPSPQFTEEARRARVEGVIVLYITIDEDGNAKVTDIVKPLGLGLEERTVKIIEGAWYFSPAMLDGVPIPYIYSVEVNFICIGRPPPP